MDEKITPRYDLAKPFCLTRFGVFQDYEIVENNKIPGKIYFRPTVGCDDIIQHTYNPLEFDDLYLTISKLDVQNTKEMNAFFKKYGLLGADYKDVASVQSSRQMVEDFQVDLTVDRDEFYQCAEAIATLSEAIEIWAEIQDSKLTWASIEKIYHKNSERSLNGFTQLIFFRDSGRIGNEVIDFDNTDVYTVAKKYIRTLINYNLSGAYESVQLVENQFVPAISFATPLDVAWWQFKNDVIGKVQFKTCLNCGSQFAVRHGHQKFCPPIPGRKSSTCENTYNQKLRRRKLGLRKIGGNQ